MSEPAEREAEIGFSGLSCSWMNSQKQLPFSVTDAAGRGGEDVVSAGVQPQRDPQETLKQPFPQSCPPP